MLYKGVFWIKDVNDIKNSILCANLACDSDGNLLNDDIDLSALGKSQNNYNHKFLWERFSNKITDNKSFDYYPRGRVEIKNKKAIIYISQYLVDYKDELLSIIIDKFGLTKANSIDQIKINIDGSEHYKPKL